MNVAILTPGELVQRCDRGTGRVQVAGRVSRISATAVTLQDAIASVDLRITAPPHVVLGANIVCDAYYDATGVFLEQVTQRESGTRITGGEFERFAIQGVGQNLLALAHAKRVARAYFEKGEFIEVTTPALVRTAGTDVYIEPVSTSDAQLITSPEFQMKRLLVGGIRRCYQFSQCHRASEHGLWHQPEFTMLEWYRAYQNIETVMRDTEQLVQQITDSLSDGTLEANSRSVTVRSFAQISVKDAFRQFAGISDAVELAATDEDKYFQLLVDAVEPGLGTFDQPVFLVDYPITQAALARAKSNEPDVAERFELYACGVELCNGYGELCDSQLQRSRFNADNSARRARGLASQPIDERLLAALNEGMPNSSGNALGFERLVALALGKPLDEVVAFPRAQI